MKKLSIIFLIFFSISNLYANSVEEDILEATNSMKKLILSKNIIPKKIIQKSKAIVIIPS